MLIMSKSYDGSFSSSFLSLQLQFKTLLEGYGGDSAIKFLDALSNLQHSEQMVVLEVFTNLVQKVANGEQRLLSEGDLARKEFEDGLYGDILEAMRGAAQCSLNQRLSVVSGGKQAAKPRAPINLADVRKSRKSSGKPILN